MFRIFGVFASENPRKTNKPYPNNCKWTDAVFTVTRQISLLIFNEFVNVKSNFI
jgi:hypothetical protein